MIILYTSNNILNRYIAKRLVKSTKCELCISSIKNLNTYSTAGSEADLVNAKTRGYLTHPDRNLFIILKNLEYASQNIKIRVMCLRIHTMSFLK